MKKIALKRLTKSDLTFFEAQYKRDPGGNNQKSINLNKNIFVDRIYPAIDDAVSTDRGEVKVSVAIYGPAGKPSLLLQRKILKGEKYKNWRLNGEFVVNPIDDPSRFDDLDPNDLALIEFEGTTKPDRLRIFLLSQSSAEDSELYESFSALVGTGRGDGMTVIDLDQVEDIVTKNDVSESHPINELLIGPELIDAAQGDPAAVTKLFRRKSGRVISRHDLKEAGNRAQAIGDDGERAVAQFLTLAESNGIISSFEWTSRENPIAPHDFKVQVKDEHRLLDVKSTEGAFSAPIHISGAELHEAVRGGVPYDLYRIYGLSAANAKLRISRDIGEQLKTLQDAIEALPMKARLSSLTLPTASLNFEPEVSIDIVDDSELDTDAA